MEEEEQKVKTEVKIERDTQEPLIVTVRLPFPKCMTEQHSHEPEVKIEIDVAEEPPLAWCMTQQHSQEPEVKTEVKIEIDVAEEPPQAWCMTQQHSHGLSNMAASSTQRLRHQQYLLQDVLEMINADDSDLSGVESTDDEADVEPGDTNYVPSEDSDSDSLEDVDAPEDVSDEHLPSTSTSTSKQRQKKYSWRKKTYEPPDTMFSGRQYSVDEDFEPSSPLAYFQKYLSSDMLELLKENTNLYSTQNTGRCVNTDKKELEQMIGMFFKMGLVKMPGNRCYWEADTRYDPVAGVMTRNRFQTLLSSLHFVDNNSVPDDDKKDKIWKIRPWLKKLRENCLKEIPEEKNSIDEMMIPFNFKGKFSKIKQYVKGKPRPWGLKVWARTSSSGVLYDFDVYQGSNSKRPPSSLGVGADVVLQLTESLSFGKNYKIFADNFFTGVPLLNALKERGMHYIGTVRGNRLPGSKLEEDKSMKKKGRGTLDWSVEETGNLVAVKWHDIRAVTTLSTYMGKEPVKEVTLYDKTAKRHVQVNRPGVVAEYNLHMGGVDLLDSYISKYRYPMKSKRWYLYIFWHTLVIMAVNAWLLYRRDCRLCGVPKKQWLRQRRFQAVLGTCLIECKAAKKRGRPSSEEVVETPPHKTRKPQKGAPPSDVRTDGFMHFPEKKAKSVRDRCKVCGMKTNTFCEKCAMPLCLLKERNCFKQYHF